MNTQEFDLNIIPDSAPVLVHVDQYDHGVGRLVASLYDDETPYAPEGASVYVQGTKPDGKFFVRSTGVSISGNVVTADLAEVMTQVAGRTRMQFVVTEPSGRTGTFVFWLDVQLSALPPDSEMSESDISMVEEAIEQMQELASDAAESAQEAAGFAQNSSDSAKDSEAWAVGTRNGEAVTPGDPTYHNNSKWYAEHGGGAGGGHTIVNSDGQDMPQRNALQFKGMKVTDDALNDMTIVEGGSGGSTIEVTTSESSLIGEDVTVTDGTNTWTSQFDNSGKAVFSGITSTGTLTVSSTDGNETAQYILTAPYFGNYAVTLAFWSATIEVSTTTSQLNGKTVYAKKNGVVMGSAVFSSGSASITVPEAGSYVLEVTLDWKTYQSSPINVTAETTYSATLNGFIAPISLTTPTSEFYGQNIAVTCDGSAVPGIAFDNTGAASFTALQAGTYVFALTYNGEPYTATVVVTSETSYSATIKMFTATINITTTSSDLYGQTIVVKKDGVQIGTTQFNGSGQASYTAHDTGSYVFEATYDGYTFSSAAVTVSTETTYSASITAFTATLDISTSSSELYSAGITIKKSGVTVGTTSFSAQGAATFRVHETGTYILESIYGGETYSSQVVVSAEQTYSVSIDVAATVTITTDASVLNGQTLTAQKGAASETAVITNGVATFKLTDTGIWDINGIKVNVEQLGQTYTDRIIVFAFHYSETDSSPDSADYPAGYTNSGYETPFSMNLSTGVPIYGDWDPSGANADDVKLIYPRSCMLKYDGTVDYYLREDDETLKEDGTASDVANASYGGNAMMEWGQDGVMYWTLISDTGDDGFTFIVSNAEVLNCKPWNHYDANGNVTPHWYTAKYFGSVTSGCMRSISGQSNFVNNAGTTEISYAQANNPTGLHIWDTEVYCDHTFIALLCCLISKSTQSQAKFGSGHTASGNTSAIGQGTMNGKGMFYGKSNGTEGVKIFGMENFYGNLYRRVRGLIAVNGTYKVKLTYDTTDGSEVTGYNTDGAGYISAGNIGTYGSWVYPKHMLIRENTLLAGTTGGSETTYYCDGTYVTQSGTFYAVVGGSWSTAGRAGAFGVGLGNAVSFASTNIGAALSCKPLAEAA
ncbi:MAG: hypothetical protein IJR31_08670 [Lachnospiraceae bacterium]|nr:hypothetical protein [Lachnospiraceae bacterium]